jgi:two-component system sensor histidine kinase UhpB
LRSRFRQTLQSGRLWFQHISTFEKVIVANSCIILFDSAVGWWVTQHNPEPYHYLIDTAFIVLASVLGLTVNFFVLRAAFAPLHTVLATIRVVARGDVHARVTLPKSGADIAVLAEAFNTMLDRLEEMRRESAARVLHAQEEERRHLALELHDQTGQSLTALALHAEAIAQRLEHERGANAIQARRQAKQLEGLAQRTLEEVQGLSRQLRPPILDDVGLEATLRWLAEDASDRLQVEIAIRIDGLDGLETASGPSARFPTDIETALFRIAQESVTNAVRHGGAQRITIDLISTATDLMLQVTDDGSGFDTTASAWTASSHRGVGVEGMQERAHLIGGRFALRSRQGQGCTVSVSVPLKHASAIADATYIATLSPTSEPDEKGSRAAEATSASPVFHSRSVHTQ